MENNEQDRARRRLAWSSALFLVFVGIVILIVVGYMNIPVDWREGFLRFILWAIIAVLTVLVLLFFTDILWSRRSLEGGHKGSRERAGVRFRKAGLVLFVLGMIAYLLLEDFGYLGDSHLPDPAELMALQVTDKQISFRAIYDDTFQFMGRFNEQIVVMTYDGAADFVVLGRPTAGRLGFDLDGQTATQEYRTADGMFTGIPVVLDRVEIGPVFALEVPAVVSDAQVDHVTLGNAFLSRIGGHEVSGNVLTLYAVPPRFADP